MLIDNVAPCVPRRELDVGDNRILRIGRIDLARRNPGDELVLANAGERMAAECDASVENLDLRRARLRHGGCRHDAGGNEAGEAKA